MPPTTIFGQGPAFGSTTEISQSPRSLRTESTWRQNSWKKLMIVSTAGHPLLGVAGS
jgi:hypothetical protein